ncbi:MAG: PIN domain-containing protein [Halosimplex sp.]
MILDTNYLIDLFSGVPAAHDKAGELQERQVVQRIPAPVLAELEYGAEWQLDEDERRKVRNLSRMYSVTELDEPLARRAGRLLARAEKATDGGTGADMIDATVAAVGQVVDEPVVTADLSDFEDFDVAIESF